MEQSQGFGAAPMRWPRPLSKHRWLRTPLEFPPKDGLGACDDAHLDGTARNTCSFTVNQDLDNRERVSSFSKGIKRSPRKKPNPPRLGFECNALPLVSSIMQ